MFPFYQWKLFPHFFYVVCYLHKPHGTIPRWPPRLPPQQAPLLIQSSITDLRWQHYFNITVPEPLRRSIKNLQTEPHSTVWSRCKIVQWMSRTFWHVSSLKCCVNIIYIVLLLLLWSSPPWSATFLNKTLKRKKEIKRPPLTTHTSFYKERNILQDSPLRAVTLV